MSELKNFGEVAHKYHAIKLEITLKNGLTVKGVVYEKPDPDAQIMTVHDDETGKTRIHYILISEILMISVMRK